MRFSRHPVKDTGLLRMTEWEKNQIPLTPFSKGGNWSVYTNFHPHLVLHSKA